MSKTFVHLHNHSEYSLLDGAQTVDEMAKRAAELEMPAMSLTDHGRMGGLLSFYMACRKQGVKPILGMEAYITGFDRSLTERVDYMKLTKEYEGTPKFERSNYHLILLCKNYEGFRNLCALSRESYAKGYYRKPRIDYATLEKYHDGLIASSACIIGQVSNLLLNHDYDGAKRVATWMRDVFGEDYYLEIMNHGLDIEMAVMEDIRRLGKELDIPVIATNDDHYTRREDHNLQKTLMLTGMHKTWQDKGVSGEFFLPGTTEVDIYDETRQAKMDNKDAGESDPIFETPAELYIKDYDEMLEFLRPCGGGNGVAEQELANTLEVAEKCNCVLPIIDEKDTSQYHVPVYNIKKDLQYDDFSSDPTHDEIPKHTQDAIIKAMHEAGIEGDTISEVLTDHELESLKFIYWICKNNFDKLIKPKVEAKGKPLEKKYWIDNPPKGFKIVHAHNSPDEQWLTKQFASGMTEEDIYKIYWDRLDYEFGIVCSKHFLDYFEIVQQYSNYVRHEGGQIGPGRGSGCGSLLNYLVGITAIDPLPNGLLFERFLNPDRTGFPDIDLDFTKDFRDNHLWPYLREQYGKDNTSQIATYQYYWGKAAIRAAARVLFQKPESLRLADDLVDLVDDKPKLDLNNELAEDGNERFKAKVKEDIRYQQIVKLALMLQGRISGESQHASAYIVSPDELVTRMPLMVAKEERERSQKENVPVDNYLIQWDGRETQDFMGYVKLDLLCIADLEVMVQTLQSIKDTYGCTIDLENIPLDDKEVFELLQDGYNAGIFQFDGSPVALRVLQESGADCIADWSAISALNRPGPLQMGYDKQFVEGKRDASKVHYFTPAAEKYLKDTYGVTVFQENLMMLSQDKEIVGFTRGEADNMRKILAHKDKAKIQGIVDLAHERAEENGVPKEVVDEFCDMAVAAGSYSFNACLTGDTMLHKVNIDNSISEISITEAYKKVNTSFKNDAPELFIICRDNDGYARKHKVKNVFEQGIRKVFNIILENGKTIKATENHRFQTSEGYKHVSDLTINKDMLWCCDFAETQTGQSNNEECYKTYLSKIISIEPVGKEQVFDIEIDSEEHNFFANGICSHNSHSLAYAVIGYRGAFLKCHFPECFLAAMCTLKPMQKGKEKIPDYLNEARQLGVKVLPPHVNYSMENFSVPKKSAIAFGLGGIKRVGASATPIIAERQAHGEYKNITDFCMRVPREVGKTPLEALIKAGALDNLGWSREALEESIESLVEFRKKWFIEQDKRNLLCEDLFGLGDVGATGDSTNDIELVPPFEDEYTQHQLMLKEKEQFGMHLLYDPRDYTQVSRFIEENKAMNESKSNAEAPRFVNISEINALPDKTMISFFGNVQDVREFWTKGDKEKGKPSKRMGSGFVWDNGRLEESRFGFSPVTYSIKLTFFPSTWEKVNRPLPDDVVHVIGRVNHDKEGRYPISVIVENIDIIKRDSEWLTSDTAKANEFATAQQEMNKLNAEYGDPASSIYMIPTIEFKNVTDLESFELDPDIENYRGNGRVQVTVADDNNDANTRILRLKQTRGMVRFAARYGGVARKTRLPKAQRALNRREMTKE